MCACAAAAGNQASELTAAFGARAQPRPAAAPPAPQTHLWLDRPCGLLRRLHGARCPKRARPGPYRPASAQPHCLTHSALLPDALPEQHGSVIGTLAGMGVSWLGWHLADHGHHVLQDRPEIRRSLLLLLWAVPALCAVCQGLRHLLQGWRLHQLAHHACEAPASYALSQRTPWSRHIMSVTPIILTLSFRVLVVHTASSASKGRERKVHGILSRACHPPSAKKTLK